MGIPEHYKGREQTLVKHTLLKAYLERLFMIIGQYAQKICYVDCFAGPWQVGSDDLEDFSIAISLNIMRKCRDGLSQRGKDVHFHALFVEKEKAPFNKLQSFLKERTGNGVDTQALNGEFHNLQDEILKWCGTENFTFFFIDPTGWRRAIEIPTLLPLLQRKNSEYLINFMFDFVLRAHSQAPFENQMKEIFGEVPDTSGMTPKQRETYLLKQYREHLKDAQPRTGMKPRSAYVKILDPYKNRTKYHLVYLTQHPLGIKVFMEESEKLDIVQKNVRAQTRQERRVEKSGQGELFNAASNMEDDSDSINLSEVKKYWLKKLSTSPKLFGIVELADMLEETGWFTLDLQKAFGELEKEKKVENIDAKKKRSIHFVHFDNNNGKGENLEKTST